MSSTSSSPPPRTNLGPLTSTFTPPSTCSLLGVEDRAPSIAYQAQQCVTTTINANGDIGSRYYNAIFDDFTCWPSTTPGVPSPTIPLNGWGVYSPGLVCPAGYHTACVAARDADGSIASLTSGTPFNFDFTLSAGETAAGCCPSNYICAIGGYGFQTCITSISTGVLPAMQCVDSTATSTFSITLPIMAASPSPVYTLPVYAPLVQLVYRSTDIEAITIVRPTVTVTSKSQASGGLNTGDKAGIGVGVVAAVLAVLVAVLAWMLVRRRRQGRIAGGSNTEDGARREMPGESKERREIDGNPVSELESSTAELSGSRLLG